MSESNHPPGMISLSYHIIFHQELREAFRLRGTLVAKQFELDHDAKAAIAKATQNASDTAEDAQVLGEFLCKELEQNIDAPLSSAGVHSGPLPPPGLLSAIYHTFIARSGTSLSVFDLPSVEERAIRDKDVQTLVTLLNADFSRRYRDVYRNVW